MGNRTGSNEDSILNFVLLFKNAWTVWEWNIITYRNKSNLTTYNNGAIPWFLGYHLNRVVPRKEYKFKFKWMELNNWRVPSNYLLTPCVGSTRGALSYRNVFSLLYSLGGVFTTQLHYNVHTTSSQRYGRCIYVEKTLCAYRAGTYFLVHIYHLPLCILGIVHFKFMRCFLIYILSLFEY